MFCGYTLPAFICQNPCSKENGYQMTQVKGLGITSGGLEVKLKGPQEVLEASGKWQERDIAPNLCI